MVFIGIFRVEVLLPSVNDILSPTLSADDAAGCPITNKITLAQPVVTQPQEPENVLIYL